MRGGACYKMATGSDGTLFTGVEWNSCSPVAFHRNKGDNIELTEDNTVATTVDGEKDSGNTIITAEPLRVGQLFKVTVTRRAHRWRGGLEIGFTGEDPAKSMLPMRRWLMWQTQDKDMIRTSSTTLHYNDKELCKLGFYTRDIQVGQWLGLLLTSEGECHWFLNGKQKGSVPVRDFPLDQPMWGVMEVFGVCEQVRADICTVSKYPPDSERRLVELGLIKELNESTRDSTQTNQEIITTQLSSTATRDP